MVIIKYNIKIPDNFTGKYYGKYSNSFYMAGKSHRYYGPAVIVLVTKNKLWYFDDKLYGVSTMGFNQLKFIKNTKETIKKLNKKWLL